MSESTKNEQFGTCINERIQYYIQQLNGIIKAQLDPSDFFMLIADNFQKNTNHVDFLALSIVFSTLYVNLSDDRKIYRTQHIYEFLSEYLKTEGIPDSCYEDDKGVHCQISFLKGGGMSIRDQIIKNVKK